MRQITDPDRLGLTVREYFAAAALQGLLAGPDWVAHTPSHIARTAALYADELIEALETDRLSNLVEIIEESNPVGTPDDELPF